MFETESITDNGETKKNMVVNPDDVSGLMRMRKKYESEFGDLFPEHKNLLDGEWRIRSFVRMCV